MALIENIFMRIGIDAKYYYSGGPSLISVVRNIVNKFIENNTEDEIVFFLIKKDAHLEEDFKMKIKGKKNMSYVFVPAKLNFYTNLFTFPFYFSKGNFDIILFLQETLIFQKNLLNFEFLFELVY